MIRYPRTAISRTTIAFALILIIAFILRFWQLDLKLLHHDEAIHSWFSYELLTAGA